MEEFKAELKRAGVEIVDSPSLLPTIYGIPIRECMGMVLIGDWDELSLAEGKGHQWTTEAK